MYFLAEGMSDYVIFELLKLAIIQTGSLKCNQLH